MATVEGVASLTTLEYGPWAGSMRSVSSELVPPEFLASPSQTPALDFLYLPKYGSWRRRLGQTIKFDTLSAGSSVVGLLPDNWVDEGAGKGARVRQIEEFLSDSVTDRIPTICALETTETVTSGLDDGYFANFWWRDQVNSLNRTLCDEYSTVAAAGVYPAPGTTQNYRVVPLWYDSGDGGITRGVTEYLRRFLLSGSRRFQKTGKWWYFPSYKGTPSRWNGAVSTVAATTLTPTSDITVWGTEMTVSGGSVSVSCDTHSNTALTSAALFGSVSEGMHISGSGIPESVSLATYVTTKTDSSNIVMSRAATNSTTATRTFQPANWQAIQTSGDSVVIQAQASAASRNFHLGLSGTVNNSQTYTINYRARYNGTVPDSSGFHQFSLVSSDTTVTSTSSVLNSSLTASFANYSIIITTGTTSPNGSFTANSIVMSESNSDNEGYYVEYDYLTVTTGNAGGALANRLIPSGPFPPTHCGTVVKGTLTASGNATVLIPDGDVAVGGWTSTGANLFSVIDDGTTANDADYITSTAAAATGKVTLTSPGFVPVSTTHTVTMTHRVRKLSLAAFPALSVDLYQNTTEKTVSNVAFATNFTTSFVDYTYSLTAAEIDSITDWTDLQFWYARSAAVGTMELSNSFLTITPISGTLGGWVGKDRFMRAFYKRFEDGSIWALTDPRFPSTTLPAGLDLVTVDSSNTSAEYDKITHTNIPVCEQGVVKIGICRTPKIDSTVDNDLQIDPFDMRLIAEVDNGTTSYDDYSADDAALGPDVTGAFIRYNHMAPPSSRYIAAGDMRAVTAYGKKNPCAIILAPVGRTTDYDLNLADSAAAVYTEDSSYFRLALASSGVMTLALVNSTGAAVATTTFATSTTAYSTLQGLVDGINATSCASNTQQWRAQLCPDVSGDALTATTLCPHFRDIDSCVVSGQTITKAAGGLGKVAVGQLVSGTGVTVGAQIVRIDSDLQLTFTGTITSGTKTLSFYNELGDTPFGLGNLGYQRAFCNALPSFMYLNSTYITTQGIEKSGTWMTVATPGSVKSAPNCFANSEANRFLPPLESGIAMGAVAVDQGFVIPYAHKIGAVKTRGPDQVRDEDYSLIIINEDHGCCAFNTVAQGNRFAVFGAPDGMYGANLDTVRKFSNAIWTAPVSHSASGLGTGDFVYEAPNSVAATAQDNDSSYWYARVIDGVVWVGYRTSASTTHANRMLAYDFSVSEETNGLKALFRKGGQEWGWSLPLSRTVSLVGFGRRSDGTHLYGWNDQNTGPTGDGRIDELEVGQTDNSTAIGTGTCSIPWIQADEGEVIQVHRVILEHNSPTGSTGSLVWHRSYSNDAYTLTPGTSSLDLLSELKHLTTPARAITASGYFEYKQATGDAREWRKLKVFLVRKPRLR